MSLDSGIVRRMGEPGGTSRDAFTGGIRPQQYTEVARAFPSSQEENQTGEISPMLALRRSSAQALGALQEVLRAAEEVMRTGRGLSDGFS
jgi:hypothetical protein